MPPASPHSILVIAGDPSGDILAAQVVLAVRQLCAEKELPEPRWFGAGGPALIGAGVDLQIDLTAHAVVGLWEVLRKYLVFRRHFRNLLAEADRQRPNLVLGVDFGAFNLRFARSLRRRTRSRPAHARTHPDTPPRHPASDWTPSIVQMVSPQVWASRPGRARRMRTTHDLVLSILPFEADWYAKNAPGLPIRFVGHPLVDRLSTATSSGTLPQQGPSPSTTPHVVLLPGSRQGELGRHLPLVLDAARIIQEHHPDTRFTLVIPQQAHPDGHPTPWTGNPLRNLSIRHDGLHPTLATATLALACTGTVTLECAWFRVPTLAFYRTSWLTYEVGRRLVTVPHLAMPNLLAGRELMPEFIQADATPERLARSALQWLEHPHQMEVNREDLGRVVTTLGPPGAARRAAQALIDILPSA